MNSTVTNSISSSKLLMEKLGDTKPAIGLILGSGLGSLADEIVEPVFIPYSEIPELPISTIEGHAGRFVAGKLGDKDVLAMQGRFHFYEGYSLDQVTAPIRLMKEIGIQQLIVTNAAGALNEAFEPGDLMLIRDHINYGFVNPLIGPNMDEFGPRFPDTSNAYDADLRDKVKEIASKQNVELKEGVYIFNTGPCYETPAEVRAERMLGGDAAGMSTVPEVLVAVHSGMKVIGISCISNMAAGILDQPLTHDEVIETTNHVRLKFSSLIKELVREI